MAQVPVFFVGVSDGQVRMVASERERMTHWLSTWSGDGELVVRRRKSKRSVDQNAYWHAVPVELMAEHCGYTHDQMHYWLLGEWGGYIDGPNGQKIPRITSSSQLSVDEFSKLITWVLDWGPSEMGVIIPAPNEVAA